MARLNDYGGEFIPGVRFNDLSREKLVSLLELYCLLNITLSIFLM